MLAMDEKAWTEAIKEIAEFYRDGPREKPSRDWAKNHPCIEEYPTKEDDETF